MTTLPKYTISTLVSLLFATCLYFLYQNIETSQSERATSTNTGVSQTNSSTIETDTGKRLTTYSESGSNWGMSPFGSGKPLEEEKKLEFKKPNTEWKSRNVTLKDGRTLNYVFGEGNPREVTVPMDKMEDFYNCKPPYENRLDGTTCPETQYLTAEIETALKTTLESPLWETVVTECRENFRHAGGVEQFDTAFITGNILDMNSLLIIDPDTGMKKLDWTKMRDLQYLMNPESDGPPLDRTTTCYKNRAILNQMVSNVFGTYNIGALTEVRGLSTIRGDLNDRLPQKYWLYK